MMETTSYSRIFLLTTLILVSLASTATPLATLLAEYRSNSPTLKAEKSQIKSFQEQEKATSAFPPPEIGLEWGSRAVSPGMSNETMYYTGFLLGQEFMFPGKRDAMYHAKAERTNMAQAEFLYKEKAGAFQLAQIYFEIHMTQARLVILDSTLSVISSILESAQRRYETGMGSMEDLFRIKAEIARLQSDSIGLVGNERALKLMLSASVGTTSPLSIPDSIDFKDEAEFLPSLDSLENLSMQRPELVAMDSEKRMASKEYSVATLRKMPNMMLQGRYMTMMGPDDWSIMVGMKLPIAPWSSAEYRSAENVAKAKEQEADSRKLAMMIMFKQEVKDAHTRYITSQERLKQVKEEQVTTAVNALRAAQISYANGKSDLTMSLDALRMAVMAWETEVMSHMNALQAILNLEKATGMYPGTWLKEVTEARE